MSNKEQHQDSKLKKYLTKLGWVGFAFFLVKGLIWLAIGYFGLNSFVGCN